MASAKLSSVGTGAQCQLHPFELMHLVYNTFYKLQKWEQIQAVLSHMLDCAPAVHQLCR
jgi:hypothetical protein